MNFSRSPELNCSLNLPGNGSNRTGPPPPRRHALAAGSRKDPEEQEVRGGGGRERIVRKQARKTITVGPAERKDSAKTATN
eukprot:753536-Hanusia_phi.AAC.10